MVKKGLDAYMTRNKVYDVCGNDYRLYASPLIKFTKACKQVVSGTNWFLSVRIGYPCFGQPRLVNGKIVGYSSWGRWRVHSGSDGGGSGGEDEPKLLKAVNVSTAPEVETAGMQLVAGSAVPVGQALHLQSAAARKVMYNLPVEQMHAPVVGPLHHNQKDLTAGLRNHRSGHVEDANLNSYSFDEQYNTFQRWAAAAKRQKTDKKAAAAQPFDPSQPFSLRSRQPWAEKQADVVELTEEQKQYMEEWNAERAERKGLEPADKGVDPNAATSTFHGKEEVDYQ
ncbi:Pre-mRNA-processing factor 17, partial [Micractinium conductrix]